MKLKSSIFGFGKKNKKNQALEVVDLGSSVRVPVAAQAAAGTAVATTTTHVGAAQVVPVGATQSAIIRQQQPGKTTTTTTYETVKTTRTEHAKPVVKTQRVDVQPMVVQQPVVMQQHLAPVQTRHLVVEGDAPAVATTTVEAEPMHVKNPINVQAKPITIDNRQQFEATTQTINHPLTVNQPVTTIETKPVTVEQPYVVHQPGVAEIEQKAVAYVRPAFNTSPVLPDSKVEFHFAAGPPTDYHLPRKYRKKMKELARIGGVRCESVPSMAAALNMKTPQQYAAKLAVPFTGAKIVACDVKAHRGNSHHVVGTFHVPLAEYETATETKTVRRPVQYETVTVRQQLVDPKAKIVKPKVVHLPAQEAPLEAVPVTIKRQVPVMVEQQAIEKKIIPVVQSKTTLVQRNLQDVLAEQGMTMTTTAAPVQEPKQVQVTTTTTESKAPLAAQAAPVKVPAAGLVSGAAHRNLTTHEAVVPAVETKTVVTTHAKNLAEAQVPVHRNMRDLKVEHAAHAAAPVPSLHTESKFAKQASATVEHMGEGLTNFTNKVKDGAKVALEVGAKATGALTHQANKLAHAAQKNVPEVAKDIEVGAKEAVHNSAKWFKKTGRETSDKLMDSMEEAGNNLETFAHSAKHAAESAAASTVSLGRRTAHAFGSAMQSSLKGIKHAANNAASGAVEMGENARRLMSSQMDNAKESWSHAKHVAAEKYDDLKPASRVEAKATLVAPKVNVIDSSASEVSGSEMDMLSPSTVSHNDARGFHSAAAKARHLNVVPAHHRSGPPTSLDLTSPRSVSSVQSGTPALTISSASSAKSATSCSASSFRSGAGSLNTARAAVGVPQLLMPVAPSPNASSNQATPIPLNGTPIIAECGASAPASSNQATPIPLKGTPIIAECGASNTSEVDASPVCADTAMAFTSDLKTPVFSQAASSDQASPAEINAGDFVAVTPQLLDLDARRGVRPSNTPSEFVDPSPANLMPAPHRAFREGKVDAPPHEYVGVCGVAKRNAKAAAAAKTPSVTLSRPGTPATPFEFYLGGMTPVTPGTTQKWTPAVSASSASSVSRSPVSPSVITVTEAYEALTPSSHAPSYSVFTPSSVTSRSATPAGMSATKSPVSVHASDAGASEYEVEDVVDATPMAVTAAEPVADDGFATSQAEVDRYNISDAPANDAPRAKTSYEPSQADVLKGYERSLKNVVAQKNALQQAKTQAAVAEATAHTNKVRLAAYGKYVEAVERNNRGVNPLLTCCGCQSIDEGEDQRTL